MGIKTKRFIQLLSAYLNQGYLDRNEGIVSIFFPGLFFRKNAPVIRDAFTQLETEASANSVRINFPVYEHRHPLILELMQAMKPLERELAGAYVHGSFATGDTVAYSDFDGLLIVKDEVIADPDRLQILAQKIRETRKLFYRIDPLQHHGWFIICEKIMRAYPTDYLPPEVLVHARSLLESRGLEQTFMPVPASDPKEKFLRNCRELRRRLLNDGKRNNSYSAKALLSEFMLMPALYVEARDRKGIYKRESFAEAARDFSKEDWKIMDEVSAIRLQWDPRLSPRQKVRLGRTGYFWNEWRKRMGPPLPPDLKAVLTPDLYRRMAGLIQKMEEKISPVN